MTDAMTTGIELAKAAGNRAAVRNVTDLKIWSNGSKWGVTPNSAKGEEACQRLFVDGMLRCGETFYMGMSVWYDLKAKLDETGVSYG